MGRRFIPLSLYRWANIEPTIPPQVGMVPLTHVCRHGTLAYVNDFKSFLKPEDELVLRKPPRVQVAKEDWHEVCQGLLGRNLCKVLPKRKLFHVDGKPVLSGLFGVTKNEFTPEGVEHLRLIMNLTPLNDLCRPLASDIATLPSWAWYVSPLFGRQRRAGGFLRGYSMFLLHLQSSGGVAPFSGFQSGGPC